MSRISTPQSLKAGSELDDGDHSDSSDEVEMPSKLIDGNAIAARIRQEVSDSVEALKSSAKLLGEAMIPGLAIIQVGNRPESEVYVRLKKKACQQVGFVDFPHILPADIRQDDLLSLINLLNRDDRIHGIIVQLPLPPHIDEEVTLTAVESKKDVDGLHPLNMAKLATVQTFPTPDTSTPTTTQPTSKIIRRGSKHLPTQPPPYVPPSFVPVMWSGPGFSVACTPLAVIELLDRHCVKLEGAAVCVVGRSSLVGIPLSMLLMQRDATVTMVHSKTRDPALVCSTADIVIVAVGRPQLVTGDWIKEGAVVIDVGINSVPIKRNSKKTKLVGDVEMSSVEPLCSLITPVPGGVGPVTLAMLLRNTLHAAQRYNAALIDRFVKRQTRAEEEGNGQSIDGAEQVDTSSCMNQDGNNSQSKVLVSETIDNNQSEAELNALPSQVTPRDSPEAPQTD